MIFESILICIEEGTILEVNQAKEVIWELAWKEGSDNIRMEVPAGVEQLPNGHILIATYDMLLEVHKKSKKLVWAWDSRRLTPKAGLHDIHLTKEGHMLTSACRQDKIWMISHAGEMIWECKIPNEVLKGKKKYGLSDRTHVNHAQMLANGNILVSVGNYGLLLELTTAGEIRHMLDVGTAIHNPQRLANGYTMLCLSPPNDPKNNKIVELDVNGNMVWEYSEGLNWVRDADRLPDGNTLIADHSNKRVFIVSPEKKVLWEYYTDGLVYEADMLINGSTLWKEVWYE